MKGRTSVQISERADFPAIPSQVLRLRGQHEGVYRIDSACHRWLAEAGPAVLPEVIAEIQARQRHSAKRLGAGASPLRRHLMESDQPRDVLPDALTACMQRFVTGDS